MILHASKIATAKTCWRKAFNSYVRFLSGEPSYGLIDGSATHAGIAEGMASKDWVKAQQVALEKFDKEAAQMELMPGEEFTQEEHRQLTLRMVECYRQAFQKESYTVLQPECRFSVDVPNSYHPDLFTHWYEVKNGQLEEHWNEFAFVPQEEREKDETWRKRYRMDRMDPEAILEGRILSPHAAILTDYLNGEYHASSDELSCKCYMPHRLNGITDSVISWHNNIWLLEHKTTTRGGPVYFDQFSIDLQITAYIWAIWKSLGILPKGAIINAIIKPSPNQVASYNRKRPVSEMTPQKDYIRFEREPVFRTKESLLDFEEDLKDHADEWVMRVLKGKFPKSNTKGICDAYMRMCKFKQLCISCDAPSELVVLQEEAKAVSERRRAFSGS